MSSINRVTIVGNLTKDPELLHTASGVAICKCRVAVNSRRKDQSTGEWGDKPNFFDVIVWGRQGESVAEHMSKGRRIGVDGRLDWREWEAQDGSKRQAVEIHADNVMYLDSKGQTDGNGHGGDFSPYSEPARDPASAPATASTTADFVPGAGYDEDIPFLPTFA